MKNIQCPKCSAGLEHLERYATYATTYRQCMSIQDGELEVASEKTVDVEELIDVTAWYCNACDTEIDYDLADAEEETI